MNIVRNIADIRSLSAAISRKQKTIALVPTMGALHEGQLKLVDTAKDRSDFVIVSIFVNPLQFGPDEDFGAYPRNLEHDGKLLADRGADVLFAPDAQEVYSPTHGTFVDVPGLTGLLCGKFRPRHFRGVCTIVCKLFNVVNPDIAVFGEKDAQQVLVIKRMVEELNMSVRILTIPTVREDDGLAMSSRNVYLSPRERNDAAVLYQSLLAARDLVGNGERNVRKIRKEMRTLICGKPSARVDYIEIVSRSSLEPLKTIDGEVLVAVAVRFGSSRLIDNISLKLP